MTTTGSPKADQESRILLVGDLLIDKTISVKAHKISPEAPVPVANIIPGKDSSVETPGGAGLAASYASKHEIPTSFLTACPPKRVKWLKRMGIETYGFRVAENIQKIRYIDVTSGYHLVRIDTDEITAPPELDHFSGLVSFQDLFRTIIERDNISIVALLDYRKGVLKNRVLTQWILEECKKLKLPVYTDSRAQDITRFQGTTIMKLNKSEFNNACKSLNVSSAVGLMTQMQLEILLITKGEEGAECWVKDKMGVFSYSSKYSKENLLGAPDVTGCGDVFDMTFCYHWGILKETEEKSLNVSVEQATRFAYEPIGERTTCQ